MAHFELELKLKLNSWLLLFTFWLLFSSIETTDPKYCDKKGNYPVKVDQVKIIPDPVLTGKPATFKISAVTDQAISAGKVVIYVSYFGVPVHQEDHELCEEISCPISAGNFVLSHNQTLPGFAPPDLSSSNVHHSFGHPCQTLLCYLFADADFMDYHNKHCSLH